MFTIRYQTEYAFQNNNQSKRYFDIGFGATPAFGGLIHTPNLDKPAAGGIKYNRFHTTPLCSPTRAALLTGRNHHQSGFGTISEGGTGYPGYNTIWGQEIASIPEIQAALGLK